MDFTLKCSFCVLALFFMAGHVCTGFTHTLSQDDELLPKRSGRMKEIVKSQLSSRKSVQTPLHRSVMSRQKRDEMFPSGVKHCLQESLRQAVENHLHYFRLRVCQETVWEAFKTFWDRLPEQSEYNLWISICLEGTLSTFDIGANFSDSEEHISLVQRRISMNATFSSEVTEEPQSTSITQEDENIQVAAVVTKEISTEATLGAGLEGVSDDTLGFTVDSAVQVPQDVIANVPLELGIEITPNGTGTNSEEMPVRVVSQSSLVISSEVSPEVIPEKTIGVTQKAFPEVPEMNTQKDVTSEGTWEAIVMQNISTEATQNVVAAMKFGAVIATPGMTVKDATAGLESVIEDENTITNEIDGIAGKPVQHHAEQLVELSVQLNGENYDGALRDPSSSAYHLLAQQFAEKIEDAFEMLPGFKEIYILEFRKQKNYRGRDAVVVHYAIALDVSSGAIGQETTDYIHLLSNSVEESYPEPDEHPAVFHSVMDFHNYVAEALHKENLIGKSTLDVEPSSLRLESVRTVFSGASRPTGGLVSSNDFMDLVLAADNPADVPRAGTHSNVLVSGFGKDTFLSDHMDFSGIKTGSHALDSRTNEVIASAETPSQLPLHFFDKPFDLKAGYISSVQDANKRGGIEEDRVLFGPTEIRTHGAVTSKAESEVVPTVDSPVPLMVSPGMKSNSTQKSTLDIGSGSGSSEGERNASSWFSMTVSVELKDSRELIVNNNSSPEHNRQSMEEKGIFMESPEVFDSGTSVSKENFESTKQTVVIIEEPDQDKTSDHTFLGEIQVSPTVTTQPDFMGTNRSPVAQTSETLPMAPSMLSVKASGMNPEHYMKLPSITSMPTYASLVFTNVVGIENSFHDQESFLRTEPLFPASYTPSKSSESGHIRGLPEAVAEDEVHLVTTNRQLGIEVLNIPLSTPFSLERESPFRQMSEESGELPLEGSAHLLSFPKLFTASPYLPLRFLFLAILLVLKVITTSLLMICWTAFLKLQKRSSVGNMPC